MLHRLRDDWLVVEALLLLFILVVNVYFLAWDDSLRQREMANRARQALKNIEGLYSFFTVFFTFHHTCCYYDNLCSLRVSKDTQSLLSTIGGHLYS